MFDPWRLTVIRRFIPRENSDPRASALQNRDEPCRTAVTQPMDNSPRLLLPTRRAFSSRASPRAHARRRHPRRPDAHRVSYHRRLGPPHEEYGQARCAAILDSVRVGDTSPTHLRRCTVTSAIGTLTASRPRASKQLHVVAPESRDGIPLPANPLSRQKPAHNRPLDCAPILPTLH